MSISAIAGSHRLGAALLEIYAMLGRIARRPQHDRLRPYLENMKRAYLRRRKKKAAKSDAPEE